MEDRPQSDRIFANRRRGRSLRRGIPTCRIWRPRHVQGYGGQVSSDVLGARPGHREPYRACCTGSSPRLPGPAVELWFKPKEAAEGLVLAGRLRPRPSASIDRMQSGGTISQD